VQDNIAQIRKIFTFFFAITHYFYTFLTFLFSHYLYTFGGSKGEKTTITLEVNEDGENNGGKRAILILKNKRKKVEFFKIDRISLPNQITTTLPADGKYTIVVAEFPNCSGRKQFQGDYCLTLEGTTGILKTLSE
jgi:hypothetical protein